MDHRDLAAAVHLPYTVDEKRRLILLERFEYGSDGYQLPDIELALEWTVCPTCEGRGAHVNPAVDAHGISAQEMDEAGDWEDYVGGAYDVPCYGCRGRRVVATSSDPRFEEAAAEAYDCARESAHTLYMETGGSMGSY